MRHRESGLSYSGAQPEHTETFNITDDETSVDRMNVAEYRLYSRLANEKSKDVVELTAVTEIEPQSSIDKESEV